MNDVVAAGNLESVRRELNKYQRGQIIDHSPAHTHRAELVPNVVPAWYVVETYPDKARTAAAYLASRRFGIFVPEVGRTTITRRGRRRDVTRPMLGDYVFVFVWDIASHLSRIEIVPGVARVLCSEPPLPGPSIAGAVAADADRKPSTIRDREINRMRHEENSERLNLMFDRPDEPARPALRQKRGRRSNKLKRRSMQHHAASLHHA